MSDDTEEGGSPETGVVAAAPLSPYPGLIDYVDHRDGRASTAMLSVPAYAPSIPALHRSQRASLVWERFALLLTRWTTVLAYPARATAITTLLLRLRRSHPSEPRLIGSTPAQRFFVTGYPPKQEQSLQFPLPCNSRLMATL